MAWNRLLPWIIAGANLLSASQRFAFGHCIQNTSSLQAPCVQEVVQWERDIERLDLILEGLAVNVDKKKISKLTKPETKLILKQLCDRDQTIRGFLNTPSQKGYSGIPAERQFFKAYLSRLNEIEQQQNIALNYLLNKWGWFKISEWGTEADDNAWLIAQHADSDVNLQKRVLNLLNRLLSTRDTNLRHYAYLFDRVAVNEYRLQRYGTQGYCTGPGTWTPRPIEDPEFIDSRRQSMGLSKMSDYIETFKNICKRDESGMLLDSKKQ